MPLTRAYLGTTSVGSATLAMDGSKSYVKKITVPADTLIAAVEAHLDTTDAETVALRPVLYEDASGTIGKLIGVNGSPIDRLKFNGRNDWVAMPLAYWNASPADYWCGVHAADPASLKIAREPSGGTDKTLNSFGAPYTGDAGGHNATISNVNDVLSIKVSTVTGFASQGTAGRTTNGTADLAMVENRLYVRSNIIPANALITSLAVRIKQSVLNGSSLHAHIFTDSASAPALLKHQGPDGQGWFIANTYRWLHFPIGLWNSIEQPYWYGVVMTGGSAFDMAYDTSGSNGGFMAGRTETAAFTPGDDDYSMHLVYLT